MELYIYWLLQGGGVLSIIIGNYALLKYYTDPHETVKVTLLIQVLAFSSVMIYILLIPFDVFATVRHHDTLFEFKDPLVHHQFHVKISDLYFICYVGMICLCFVWLPFSYFYAQSVQEEEERMLEATLTREVLQKSSSANATPGKADGSPEKASTLKGMDSSASDEEDATNANGEKPLMTGQNPSKQDEFTQDTDPEFGFGDGSRQSFIN
jgi:hypothetical protein